MGYSKQLNDNNWVVSNKTIEILRQYKQKFPSVVAALESMGYGGDVEVGTLFPQGDGNEILSEVTKWLKTLPTYTADTIPCGSTYLSEQGIQAVEAVQNRNTASPAEVTLQGVKPYDVHLLVDGPIGDGADIFALGDRVVCINDSLPVPIGAEGNVISVFNSETHDIDVVFDQPFQGGSSLDGRCTLGKGLRMAPKMVVKRMEGGSKKGKGVSTNVSQMPWAQAAAGAAPAAAPAAVEFAAPSAFSMPLPTEFEDAAAPAASNEMPAANALLAMLQQSGATVGKQQSAKASTTMPSAAPQTILQQARNTMPKSSPQFQQQQVDMREQRQANMRGPARNSPRTERNQQSKGRGKPPADFGVVRQPKMPSGRGFTGTRSSPDSIAAASGGDDLDEYAKMWEDLQQAQSKTAGSQGAGQKRNKPRNRNRKGGQ